MAFHPATDSPVSTMQQEQQERQQQQQEQQEQQEQQQHDCYVIVYNVSKKHNIGTLLRSCTAFGVKEACLVGSRSYSAFGSHGSAEHVALRHFNTIQECVTYLKETAGCRILGVEIDPSAQPVHTHPFTGNTAFMLGNEGQGLSEKQMALCDGFVIIPQHGGGTASLNVTVAASIVLHHFAIWAGYPERQRHGAKFAVEPRPQRTRQRGVVPLTPEQRQQQREASAAAGGAQEAWLAEAFEAHGGLDGLLDALGDDGDGAAAADDASALSEAAAAGVVG